MEPPGSRIASSFVDEDGNTVVDEDGNTALSVGSNVRNGNLSISEGKDTKAWITKDGKENTSKAVDGEEEEVFLPEETVLPPPSSGHQERRPSQQLDSSSSELSPKRRGSRGLRSSLKELVGVITEEVEATSERAAQLVQDIIKESSKTEPQHPINMGHDPSNQKSDGSNHNDNDKGINGDQSSAVMEDSLALAAAKARMVYPAGRSPEYHRHHHAHDGDQAAAAAAAAVEDSLILAAAKARIVYPPGRSPDYHKHHLAHSTAKRHSRVTLMQARDSQEFALHLHTNADTPSQNFSLDDEVPSNARQGQLRGQTKLVKLSAARASQVQENVRWERHHRAIVARLSELTGRLNTPSPSEEPDGMAGEQGIGMGLSGPPHDGARMILDDETRTDDLKLLKNLREYFRANPPEATSAPPEPKEMDLLRIIREHYCNHSQPGITSNPCADVPEPAAISVPPGDDHQPGAFASDEIVSTAGPDPPLFGDELVSTAGPDVPLFGDYDEESNRVLAGTADDELLIPSAELVAPESGLNLQQAEQVDETREAKARAERKRRSCRMVSWEFMGGLMLAVGVTALLLSFLLNKNEGCDLGPTETLQNSTDETEALRLSLESRVMNLLPFYTRDAMRNHASPQYKAFQWLVNDASFGTYEDWRIMQRFSLAAFFQATGGPGWQNNTNWLSYRKEECEWYSRGSFIPFEVDDNSYYEPDNDKPCQEGVYRNLWLWNNLLVGPIPPELYLLTTLRSLSLNSNKELAGTISSLIGKIRSLEAVSIHTSALTGAMPSQVGMLQNLSFLALVKNQLTGALPTELGKLFNLRDLILDKNSFTSTIPSELGLLKNLSGLILYGNLLTGSIPKELGNLEAIEKLQLYSNQLTSTIPPELGLLSNLSWLHLFYNFLTGTIPVELSKLTALEELALLSNQLTSSIPSELGLLTNLTFMFLSKNALTATIPFELGLLTSMSLLFLHQNALTGSIGTELGYLKAMDALLLHTNNLTSTIPSELGLLTRMWRLSLHHNDLTGFVPSELGFLTNMAIPNITVPTTRDGLMLQENSLAGKIPSELGQLSRLPRLWLQTNDLTGSIPNEIYSLVLSGSLTELNVSGNELLSGTIPYDVCFTGFLDFDCTKSLCGCNCSCSGWNGTS